MEALSKIRRWKKHHAIGLTLTALLALYGAFLYAYFIPTDDGDDPNGYHVCAKMFQEHGRFYQKPTDQLSFLGTMWVVNDKNEFYPKYPPFYPWLAGLAMRFFGDQAGFYINPICALLAILGIYFLSRSLLPPWAAFLAALSLASNPTFNLYAIRQLSHSSSICFLIWGYVLFFLALRADVPRWGRTPLLFISGLTIAFTAGIRYTNVIMALPALLCIGFPILKSPKKISHELRFFVFCTALAIPYGFLAYYHWQSFGHFLLTGYALTEEQTGFTWSYFLQNIVLYVKGLIRLGLGPLFPFFIFGFICVWRQNWRKGAFFTISVVPLSILSSFYYWVPDEGDHGFLRLLLPTIVAEIILAFFFLNKIHTQKKFARETFTWLTTALILIQFSWGSLESIGLVEKQSARNRLTQIKLQFILDHAPEGSVVFAKPRFLNALDFHQKYKLYPNRLLNRRQLKKYVDRVLKPCPGSLQKDRAYLMKRLLLDIDPKHYDAKIRELFQRHLDSKHAVFILNVPKMIDELQTIHQRHFNIEIIAELDREYQGFILLPSERLDPAIKEIKRHKPVSPLKLLKITGKREKTMSQE